VERVEEPAEPSSGPVGELARVDSERHSGRPSGKLNNVDVEIVPQGQMLDDSRDRASPAQAEDVAASEKIRDDGRRNVTDRQFGSRRIDRGGSAHYLAEPQPEALREGLGEVRMEELTIAIFDLDETAFARLLEEPGDPEPRDAEPVPDLDLRQLFVVKKPADLDRDQVFGLERGAGRGKRLRRETFPTPRLTHVDQC
jgi:hypothetical protein